VAVALALVLGLVILHWAFLEEMDALAFDFALRLRGPQAPDSRIVIVGVDELSLEKVGPWPWPPETISRLLAEIDSAGPLAIGVDLILTHPLDEYPILKSLDHTVVASVLEAGRGTARGDLNWKEPDLSDRENNIAAGHIHAGKDADGVCRSIPVVVRAGGKERWAFAVELARVVLGVPPDQVRFEGDRLQIGDQIGIPRLSVPIDQAVDSAGILSTFRGDHMLINPRGDTYTFPHVPAATTLEGDPQTLKSLRGRIVLVGATAYALGDHLSTPFTGPSEMPGIEIHANALDTILDRRFLDALVEPWLTVFLVVLALTVWVVLAIWPRARTLPLFLLLVGAAAALPLALFLVANYWIPVVSTTAVVLVSGTTSQFLHYSRLNRQLNQRYRELSSLLADSRPGLKRITADATYPSRSVEWKLHLIGEASEAALRLSKVRSEMTSFVSHELKTPLTSIQGFAELLEQPGLLTEEDRTEAARSIRAESIRLSKMVTDFLRLSRLEHQAIQVTKEPIVISEVLARAGGILDSQLRSKRIELRGIEEGPEVTVQGDPELLTQVFLNLLGNAVKFSPEETTVEVTSRVESEACVVRVSDQGPGIPPEDLPRLFQKFFRGRADSENAAPGSGLGLAFVKEVVSQHGGTVEVTSQVGEGSVFTVTLPRRPQDR
jgi:signal transduction histidine kinase